jgi:hypothetical protein
VIQSVEHVARMGIKRYPFKCWLETLIRRDYRYIILWCIPFIVTHPNMWEYYSGSYRFWKCELDCAGSGQGFCEHLWILRHHNNRGFFLSLYSGFCLPLATAISHQCIPKCSACFGIPESSGEFLSLKLREKAW